MFNKQPSWEQSIADYVMQNKESFYRLAYSYVQNPQDALDVVQDSIQKAITAKSLKDRSAIRSWLYKIVVHTSLDHLRRKKRVTIADDVTIQLHSPGVMDQYADIDLRQALDALPPEYRSVIVLRYFEDLKIEEVADVLDLNVSTAKTRIYKGLNILRDQMKAIHIEEEQHHG